MVKYYYDWSVFMYKKKNRAKQHQMQFITLDDLVPADHILRLIDDAIDMTVAKRERSPLTVTETMTKP